MSSFIKPLLKWLLVTALILGPLFAGFVLWLEQVDKEAAREVASFPPGFNQLTCVDESARRAVECDSPSCAGRMAAFEANCLLAVKESRANFCNPSPQPSALRARYCDKHNLRQDMCEDILEVVASYCSEEFSQQSIPSDLSRQAAPVQ